jgi:hypothetical protein
MKNYYLKVHGQVSEELLIKAKINITKTDSNIILMLSYSEFTINKNSQFNYVTIDGKMFRINGILTYITQQFSLPFDEIPQGWKTVGIFDLKDNFEFVKLIPFTEGWVSKDSEIIIGFDDSFLINGK